MAGVVVVGVGLVFLISGSAARADTTIDGSPQPFGVAVDGSGDVFIAGDDGVLVDKPNGSGGYTQSVVDPDLIYPQGVAVDGPGDVFTADTGNDRVVVDKPNESGGYTQSAVGAGLAYPEGVAVDASGNVFIADTGNGRVVVDKPNGSGDYTQEVAITGLSGPSGIAVDGSGDLFIVDNGTSRVLVEKPNGSGGYLQSVVDTDLSGPSGVAVDASGDVFIADTGNDRVVVDKPNGSGGYTQSVVDTGVRGPYGVAVDASGNVFIADTYNNRVVEHAAGSPTALFTSAQSAISSSVAFTEASTAVSPATITGWSWNFGDGSPVSTQRNPHHAYGSTGGFPVSLTVTDSKGRTDTATVQVVVTAVEAPLGYPTAGETDVSTAYPFGWEDIAAAQGYQLWIGTSRGDGSLLKSGLLPATASSYRVPALATGVTLWARLYTEVAGTWGNYEDVPFKVTANRFTFPTAGQQNINPLTPFSWSPQTGAQAYRLTIGTKPGWSDLVNSGVLAAWHTNYREPALPTGKTLYARIACEFDGSWSEYQDVSFTAAPNPVAFTHPTQGQTAVNSPATFSWTTSPAATGYQLWIGTSRGDGSLLKSGLLKATTSSYQMPALPAGKTLWARIYTGVTTGWGNWEDISFTTAGAGGGQALATAIRRRAITDRLAAHAAVQPTPAWMRRLLELEPDLNHPSPARTR